MVAAAPFVLTQARDRRAARTTPSGVYVVGIAAGGPGRSRRHDDPVARDRRRLPLRQHATAQQRGVVLGKLLADRAATRTPGDTHQPRLTSAARRSNPVTGMLVAERRAVRGHRDLRHRDVRVRQRVRLHRRSTTAQELAGLGDDVTGIEVKTTRPLGGAERRRRGSPTRSGCPYRTVDWQEQNSLALSGAQAGEARHGA